jgi:hypothetical protein
LLQEALDVFQQLVERTLPQLAAFFALHGEFLFVCLFLVSFWCLMFFFGVSYCWFFGLVFVCFVLFLPCFRRLGALVGRLAVWLFGISWRRGSGSFA